MTTHVVTACYFPGRQPIWRLQQSCDRHGIVLHPYGVGVNFKSWRHAKVSQLVGVARERRDAGATHLLYTDGQDAWFMSGLDEVNAKFLAIGKPIVISAERECYPYAELHESFPCRQGYPWRYINAGQFMGEASAVIDVLEMLLAEYGHAGQNDQGYWCQAWADGKLPMVHIDQECQLFQTMARESVSFGEHDGSSLAWENGRWLNRMTRSYPSLLHFNGGGNKETRMQECWR